jgi:hypothetical protein
MTLTQQRFKTIFYIVLGLCILTIVLSATSFDFVEIDTAVSWTMKYFALPILIIMIPSCYSIYLKAKIVDYYTTRNKGRTKFHIKIQDNQIDRIVELQVDKPYKIGQQFTKTMYIGMWGLLYSRE